MGYSAFTPMKSAKMRDLMLAFMAEHYRPWHLIQPTAEMNGESINVVPVTEEWDWTAYLRAGEDLDYNPGKLKIGFNFPNSMDPLGHYGSSILRWMALHGGKRCRINKDEVADLGGETVPAMVYDYDPAWPVLVRSEWEDRCPQHARWCLTDANGFKPMRRPWMPPNIEIGDSVTTGIGLWPATDEQKAAIRAFFADRWPELSDEVEKTLAEKVPTFTGSYNQVQFLQGFLERKSIPHEIETTPFTLAVLGEPLTRIAEQDEPAMAACDKVIEAELARLSKLWEGA